MNGCRETDAYYMGRAIALAMAKRRLARPNPTVAAVIVKDNHIIGEGVHVTFGGSHAEVIAIADAKARGEAVKGATLYVTLEPCSHYGKTPPCSERLVEEGIARVVIACEDPNPVVAGRGITYLRENGVNVTLGILEREAREIIPEFSHWIRHGKPLGLLKAATSLDGQLATHNGVSKWISGPESRQEAHQLRARTMAILIGANTLRQDNPELTVRNCAGPQPLRVVISQTLELPLSSKLFHSEGGAVNVYTGVQANREKVMALKQLGVNVVELKSLSLEKVMSHLAQSGIDSVLVEGGGGVHREMLDQKLVQELHLFLSMKLMGGQNSVGLIGGQESLTALENLPRVIQQQVKPLGEDLYISGKIEYDLERQKAGEV